MIKAKLSEIIAADKAFGNLLGQKLAARVNYHLLKIAKAASSEVRDFQAAQKEMLDKYGTKTEQEGVYNVPPENRDKYNQEITELLSSEVELNALPFPFEWIENATVEGNDLLLLNIYFTEPLDFGEEATDATGEVTEVAKE